MHGFTRLTDAQGAVDTTLTLPYALRRRSRQRVRLDNGEDAGLYLARGTVLRHGDRLVSSAGLVVAVRAAPETVSTVHCATAEDLALVCYHLGNRHVDVQIETDRAHYLQDDVLDAMVRALGFEVIVGQQPFEPLPGAYGTGRGTGHGG